MAKDYEGNLVCLRCLNDQLRTQLTDKYLDTIDQRLMSEDVYK